MYSGGGSSEKDDEKYSNVGGDASSNHGSNKFMTKPKKKKGSHHGSTHKHKYGSDQEELPPIVGGAVGKKKGKKYGKTGMFPPFKKSKPDHNKYVSPYQKKKVGGASKAYALYQNP